MFITKVVHHLRRMHLAGWIELDGKLLSGEELMQAIRQDPGVVSRFGGEFYLEFGSCAARDYYGIIQGPCPAGTIICDGSVAGFVRPSYPALPLADAIRTAVRLRSDIGITALSGGVDSALIAAIARQPCLVTGMEGCHDIRQAEKVAALLDLPLHIKVVTPEEVENALPVVIGLIDDDPTPVDLGIGTTLYFVAETAGKLGHQRILTGQGADELFGGYARYQDAPACLLNMMFADDLPRLTGKEDVTRVLQDHLGPLCQCHTLMSGLYALQMHCLLPTGCREMSEKNLFAKLPGNICLNSMQITRKKLCSTGPGSGKR